MTRMSSGSEDEEFGFSENTLSDNIATFSIDRVITRETIPDWNEYKETEFIKDKSCIQALFMLHLQNMSQLKSTVDQNK